MVSRFGLSVLLAILSPLLLTAPVAAGGWAVSTLDELPAEGMRAGETYQLGYTIRQHGVTPVRDASSEIRARLAPTGKAIVFQATETKVPGRYVAEVTFPSEGQWTWEVLQGPFGVQALGTVDVRPAGVAKVGSEPDGLSFGWVSVGAAALVAVFGAAVLVGLTARRRPRAEVA